MKQKVLFTTVSFFAILMSGGCSSTHVTRGPLVQTDIATLNQTNNAVALTTLGPVVRTQNPAPVHAFHLGAGDALGQAIYTNYAAIARANAGMQYAGVSE